MTESTNRPSCPLPDHASEPDERALPIDKVGIKDLSYPIQVMDRENKVQHTVARVSLYVSLPHDFKGTHMSRFVELLHARRGEMTLRSIPGFLEEMQRRLDANDAHLEASFPYFLSRRAPVSGVESLMEYPCTFRASRRGEQLDFVLCVRVPVKSLCPCSKAISERGAHNQRSLVDVELRFDNFVWIEEVVEVVEACASAPLFALLKREDEKYVTELAYDNPKFVEDLVRDVVLRLRAMAGVRWLRVSAENQESIHNHSAFACIEWSAEEERLRAPTPEAPLEEEPPFGGWLRQQRALRGLSQQALADHLGITAAHLSRVESGEKRLSPEALQRVAELLGLAPEEVCLRGGVVPAAMLAFLCRHPRELRAWVAARQGM